MKQLKSTVSELRELFEHSITAKDIAEPLVSFDYDHPATAVKQFMEQKKFDVVGIRKEGEIAGYVQQVHLDEGRAGDYLTDFEKQQIFSERAPLLVVLPIISASERAFIDILGQVGGIITKGDLQKIPVRMWIFGLISLLEMQMLRMIRRHYPDDSWSQFLAPGRIEKARQLNSDRIRRNSEVDLADCLQFCDKRDIFIKSDQLYPLVRMQGPESDTQTFKTMEDLRNDVDHIQNIISERWPSILHLIEKAEQIIRKLETY